MYCRHFSLLHPHLQQIIGVAGLFLPSLHYQPIKRKLNLHVLDHSNNRFSVFISTHCLVKSGNAFHTHYRNVNAIDVRVAVVSHASSIWNPLVSDKRDLAVKKKFFSFCSNQHLFIPVSVHIIWTFLLTTRTLLSEMDTCNFFLKAHIHSKQSLKQILKSNFEEKKYRFLAWRTILTRLFVGQFHYC